MKELPTVIFMLMVHTDIDGQAPVLIDLYEDFLDATGDCEALEAKPLSPFDTYYVEPKQLITTKD